MRSLVFEECTWLAYERLRKKDKKLHEAARKILTEMLRSDPSAGSGKPEHLRHSLSGFWSRRISQKDRIIYQVGDQYVYVVAIGWHYERL